MSMLENLVKNAPAMEQARSIGRQLYASADLIIPY